MSKPYEDILAYMLDDIDENVDRDELKQAHENWNEFQAAFKTEFDRLYQQIKEAEADGNSEDEDEDESE